TGRMAAVVLETLASLDALPERYAILEVSADLRARQQERLAQLPLALRERVVWLDRLPAQPLRGVILANEVLDALPCHRFVVHGSAVRVLGVSVAADGSLVEQEAAADKSILAELQDIAGGLPEGYRSEVC